MRVLRGSPRRAGPLFIPGACLPEKTRRIQCVNCEISPRADLSRGPMSSSFSFSLFLLAVGTNSILKSRYHTPRLRPLPALRHTAESIRFLYIYSRHVAVIKVFIISRRLRHDEYMSLYLILTTMVVFSYTRTCVFLYTRNGQMLTRCLSLTTIY